MSPCPSLKLFSIACLTILGLFLALSTKGGTVYWEGDHSADDWYESAWFGWVYAPNPGFAWQFHQQLGWYYPVSALAGVANEEAMFLYSPGLGWLFTGEGTYPHLYAFDAVSWVAYEVGSYPCRFYNYRTSDWEVGALSKPLQALQNPQGMVLELSDATATLGYELLPNGRIFHSHYETFDGIQGYMESTGSYTYSPNGDHTAQLEVILDHYLVTVLGTTFQGDPAYFWNTFEIDMPASVSAQLVFTSEREGVVYGTGQFYRGGTESVDGTFRFLP